VRDESPASDLDALVSSVERDLKPRLLPNGREYCAELSRTDRDKDECTGDLEDVVFVSNRDKERAKQTLRTGVQRIKLARNPCSMWEKMFRADRCKINEGE
jgi:hypothetical protein